MESIKNKNNEFFLDNETMKQFVLFQKFMELQKHSNSNDSTVLSTVLEDKEKNLKNNNNLECNNDEKISIKNNFKEENNSINNTFDYQFTQDKNIKKLNNSNLLKKNYNNTYLLSCNNSEAKKNNLSKEDFIKNKTDLKSNNSINDNYRNLSYNKDNEEYYTNNYNSYKLNSSNIKENNYVYNSNMNDDKKAIINHDNIPIKPSYSNFESLLEKEIKNGNYDKEKKINAKPKIKYISKNKSSNTEESKLLVKHKAKQYKYYIDNFKKKNSKINIINKSNMDPKMNIKKREYKYNYTKSNFPLKCYDFNYNSDSNLNYKTKNISYSEFRNILASFDKHSNSKNIYYSPKQANHKLYKLYDLCMNNELLHIHNSFINKEVNEKLINNSNNSYDKDRSSSYKELDRNSKSNFIYNNMNKYKECDNSNYYHNQSLINNVSPNKYINTNHSYILDHNNKINSAIEFNSNKNLIKQKNETINSKQKFNNNITINSSNRDSYIINEYNINNCSNNQENIKIEDIKESLRKEIEHYHNKTQQLNLLISQNKEMQKKIEKERLEFDRKMKKEREEFNKYKENELKNIKKQKTQVIGGVNNLKITSKKDLDELNIIKSQMHKVQEDCKLKEYNSKVLIDSLKKQLLESNKILEKISKGEAHIDSDYENVNNYSSLRSNNFKKNNRSIRSSNKNKMLLNSNSKARNISPKTLEEKNIVLSKKKSDIEDIKKLNKKKYANIQSKINIKIPESLNNIKNTSTEKDIKFKHKTNIKYIDKKAINITKKLENVDNSYVEFSVDNQNKINNIQNNNNNYDNNANNNNNYTNVINNDSIYLDIKKDTNNSNLNKFTHSIADISFEKKDFNETSENNDKKSKINDTISINENNDKSRDNIVCNDQTLTNNENETDNKLLYNDKYYKNKKIYNEESVKYSLYFPSIYKSEKKLLKQEKLQDNKIVNFYDNDVREVIFPSGLYKEIHPDGYQLVNFPNNDVKQLFPDGRMIYFFFESKTVQHTIPSENIKVFKFSNGQIEKHFDNDTKEILFPNGIIKYITENGSERSYDE